MLQREVFPEYRRQCAELNKAYEYLKSLFKESDVAELCEIRGYVSQEQVNLLFDMNIGACVPDVEQLKSYSSDICLLSENGNFLLENRYIVPIYGVNGDLVSLVGYFNDYKKYITLPTPFFSKECMFFNFKQAYELSWREYGGLVFLVEGIFDCLSLRSIDLPCIATMGASVSPIKKELLKLFRKVIAIPDDDTTGRKALNRFDKKHGWQVPENATFIKFRGGEFQVSPTVYLHCKDMDNFVSWYEADDVREILLSFKDCHADIEELVL